MTGSKPGSGPHTDPRRARIYQIVFEADTRAGRLFDITLTILIILSIVTVSIDSLRNLSAATQTAMAVLEWLLTALFTAEYALRLYSTRNPALYATSFFGIIDLIAILPTWLGLFIPGAQTLLVVRVLRLLRIFRILKLARFLSEAERLTRALKQSLRKIVVFLLAVTTIIVIVGSLMFVVEGPDNGFTSLPVSMYWAVVTLTTVGFGDIAPKTALGQALASLVMILGYGIIAVPTGIVTSELTAGRFQTVATGLTCPSCKVGSHDIDARFCRVCGEALV